MDAIIMEKIISLLQSIKSDAVKYPHLTHLTLKPGEMFSWNHTACAITYDPDSPFFIDQTLHEYGHATLNHTRYKWDIELLAMERDAWREAIHFAEDIHVKIDAALAQTDLDTYRDWLHARSTCPKCGNSGLQKDSIHYQCLFCDTIWRVNSAKQHQLRRYINK